MSNITYSIFSNRNFVDCTLYQFGWEQCEAAHSFGPASRNHYLFHYIIHGKGTLFSTNGKGDTKKYDLHAGQGFLISPNQINHYIADDKVPWEYTWLEFDGLKAQELITLAGLSFDDPIYHTTPSFHQDTLKNEMLYIVHHASESPFCLIGHLYLFFDALIQASNKQMALVGGKLKDFYVREAISFIEHNYHLDITIEEIASFCNLNRSYFGKIFKDVVATTPQDFLIRYRMTKACELLETSDLPIGEISLKTGYPSQLHFSRAFKKIYEISPRQWRLTNMKKAPLNH